MRIGFAVKVMGRAGLKSDDSRRWQNAPHLSVSLAYLRDILVYLAEIDVHMYRMSSNLAPYVTHPDLPQFHNQIDACEAELAAIGAIARQRDVRLSFHPAAYVVLNSVLDQVAIKAVADLEAQSRMLDLMGLGDEAVVVTHVGGAQGSKAEAIQRFVERFSWLSWNAQARLALENDDHRFTMADTLVIHQQTGVRLVMDHLHYLCNPTPGLPLVDALRLALGTWPAGQVPKIHFSTPSSSLVVSRSRESTAGAPTAVREPRLGQHADLIDPFAFVDLLRAARDLVPFDVMLECKAKDIALLRLRRQIEQLAPHLPDELAIW